MLTLEIWAGKSSHVQEEAQHPCSTFFFRLSGLGLRRSRLPLDDKSDGGVSHYLWILISCALFDKFSLMLNNARDHERESLDFPARSQDAINVPTF